MEGELKICLNTDLEQFGKRTAEVVHNGGLSILQIYVRPKTIFTLLREICFNKQYHWSNNSVSVCLCILLLVYIHLIHSSELYWWRWHVSHTKPSPQRVNLTSYLPSPEFCFITYNGKLLSRYTTAKQILLLLWTTKQHVKFFTVSISKLMATKEEE